MITNVIPIAMIARNDDETTTPAAFPAVANESKARAAHDHQQRQHHERPVLLEHPARLLTP